MRTVRRRALFTGLCAAALVLLTAGAWACVFGPSVFLTRSEAKAGEAIELQGLNFRPDIAVVARLNALDGPVVGQFGVPEGDRRMVTGALTIPPGTAPGNYVVVFTQPGRDGVPAQVPTRALITVLGDGGTTPVVGREVGVAEGDRAARLDTDDESVSAATLLLVGLGTAGAGMFLGGVAGAVIRRRPAAPRAEKVQA